MLCCSHESVKWSKQLLHNCILILYNLITNKWDSNTSSHNLCSVLYCQADICTAPWREKNSPLATLCEQALMWMYQWCLNTLLWLGFFYLLLWLFMIFYLCSYLHNYNVTQTLDWLLYMQPQLVCFSAGYIFYYM